MSSCTRRENGFTMRHKISYFFELFSKLDTKIQERYADSYDSYKNYRGAILLKMQLLELIKYRYMDSQVLINDCFEEFKRHKVAYKTSADPEILKNASEFSERFRFARRSLQVDIESFLVFSRVVLDYIPWMLQPFLKGVVALHMPSTYDFRKFCEWFRDHPDLVTDREFNEFLMRFYEWFMTNLRNPRNELVIHLERQYTLDRISFDGKIIRMRYSPETGPRDLPADEFQLISPVELFDHIYKFLIQLESHFVKLL